MSLTTEQLQTLKTWLLANATQINEHQAADALNQNAFPVVNVYRTLVGWDTIMQNGMDWTRVDNLSVGKARIWEWMFDNADNAINSAKPNIRSGINAIWVGTAADLAVRASVYGHCVRPATVAESLYATGDGTAPNASGNGPATMGWEGLITAEDVINAYNVA